MRFPPKRTRGSKRGDLHAKRAISFTDETKRFLHLADIMLRYDNSIQLSVFRFRYESEARAQIVLKNSTIENRYLAMKTQKLSIENVRTIPP